LAPETRVTGRVARISREDVFVDLGGRNQGIVPLRQFETPPAEGSELELMVVRFDPEEGLYEVSKPTAAVDVGNWDEVREGQIVEVTVTGSNKGGLECQIANIRGFIPMGQVSLYRVENPEEFVGQRLACVVTEANRERRNLVLSHRAVMERERNEMREKLLAELAPGQIREGIVRSMKDFGAFVDLGGVDGLVHVSQLSWDRVNHPSEVLQVGQKIKVRVEKFDKETGKLSLSYREVGVNPWQDAAKKYIPGGRATGVVSRIMDFGAFVKLEPGVEGLIHISEISHGRVFRVGDIVSEGQEVEVKILTVDVEKQRISLSLKALQARPEKPGEKQVADEDLPLPPEAPKPPRKTAQQLKGGIGGPSGGEKFGLNW
jgi:small subunit ribosomal protein S1